MITLKYANYNQIWKSFGKKGNGSYLLLFNRPENPSYKLMLAFELILKNWQHFSRQHCKRETTQSQELKIKEISKLVGCVQNKHPTCILLSLQPSELFLTLCSWVTSSGIRGTVQRIWQGLTASAILIFCSIWSHLFSFNKTISLKKKKWCKCSVVIHTEGQLE